MNVGGKLWPVYIGTLSVRLSIHLLVMQSFNTDPGWGLNRRQGSWAQTSVGSLLKGKERREN